MKPICVPCQRFYRPEKNGFWFLEGMPIANAIGASRVEPGTSEKENWRPYKLWVGDLWKCEGCGHLTITGVSQRNASEHYMGDFHLAVKKYATKYKDLPYPYQVNDC